MQLPIKTYKDALKYIFKEDVTKKYDLTAISKADALLGYPHRSFTCIHVAGTNGKGSVTKMVFSVLQKAGKSVGCLTSPHLVDFRERIETNPGKISPKDVVRHLNKILATKVPLSYTELCTMIAFLHFKEMGCEYAVIEVGMGGTLDATNIIVPEITCITNIGLDHQNFLGRTISQIARQKAGIIKPRIPLVLGQKNSVIEKIAKDKKAPIIFATKEHPTNMLGAHQKRNADIAYHVCKYLGIAEKYIKQGLGAVDHPGRLQYVSHNLLIDGAHNIDGLLSLKAYLETLQGAYLKTVYCFSLKKGKDPHHLIVSTFGKDKTYIIVKKKGYQLEDFTLLGTEMKGVSYIFATPSQIRQFAKKNPTTLYIVFGSLYMIGDFII